MIATNYHNEQANFEVNHRVKFVDDNGQIFSATIIDINGNWLELYFEDAENSRGVELASNCFHAQPTTTGSIHGFKNHESNIQSQDNQRSL